MNWVTYAMIGLGAALMVYNIIGFIRFSRFVQKQSSWTNNNAVLRIPIVLLILFLAGYVAVGVFGKPDLIVGGIFFGGSIFVFIMYKLLFSITRQIIENEMLKADLIATEKSNQVKARFLADVSHEMRTPLNVILGLDAVALNNDALQPETREQLKKIGFSAKHLLSIINNILDVNDMESKNLIIKEEQFLLSDAMDQINAIINTLCENKGLTYNICFPENLNGMYTGDALHLKHVLLSILDNAVKYTDPPGNVRLAVDIAGENENRRLFRFVIEDTGIGIAADFLPKVFDAFSREKPADIRVDEGSGLGMAVTRNLVELMGGSIQAESEKGKGTVFTVLIPLLYNGLPEADPVQEHKEQINLAGRRVLIVEDIPENAEILADLLELENVETEHAENGKIALDMVEHSQEGYYDAILMDLRMPVMDGLEATRRIRALDRNDVKTIPIIAHTAHAYESDVAATLEAGMNEHLAKPVDADKLYTTLNRLIRTGETV